ncbi:FG-GAP repeat domain-containing protein [Celeribacter sp.]|uniref:FG-GAP repeat domain-containing protein n=1 Tax=Celeribacter sp. TaxID=1890673 RepID=UPI003A944191
MRALAICLALVAAPAIAQEAVTADYVRPTNAYGHGALLDGEFEGLRVTFSDGSEREIHVRSGVFEDTAPRLYDFDGDGAPEIVTVFSTNVGGAMIQIWGAGGGKLTIVGQNRPIGQRHRWLSIAGIADFDGDGLPEIAYIDRPHLTKELVLLEVEPAEDRLHISEIARVAGLTNHHYGASVIEGGVRTCDGAAPVIVTADADWSQIVETRYEGDTITHEAVAPYQGSDSFAPYLACD